MGWKTIARHFILNSCSWWKWADVRCFQHNYSEVKMSQLSKKNIWRNFFLWHHKSELLLGVVRWITAPARTFEGNQWGGTSSSPLQEPAWMERTASTGGPPRHLIRLCLPPCATARKQQRVCVSANSCRRAKSGSPPVKSVRGNSNSAGRKCNRKHLLKK